MAADREILSVTTPIVYRPSVFSMVVLGANIIFVGFALVLFARGFAGTFSVVTGLMTALTLCGLYFLFSILRTRVMLFSDRMEIMKPGRTTILLRGEIQGWKIIRNVRFFDVLVLSPSDGTRRIRVALTFTFGGHLEKWLRPVPNLDSIDSAVSLRGIQENVLLGTNITERLRALAQGRRLGWVINGVAGVIALFALFFPHPYRFIVVILGLLPWVVVAVIRLTGGLFHADDSFADVRPNLAVAFIAPALILYLRGSADYRMVRMWSLVEVSVGAALLLFAAIVVVSPAARSRGGALVMLGLSCLAYGYGVAMEANALLDQSAGSVYSAVVVKKYLKEGNSPSYWIGIRPSWAEGGVVEIRVRQDTYDATHRNDVVHVVRQRGAFGAAWYFVQEWQGREVPGFRF